MSDLLVIKLPFCGFYESKYSGEIDHIEEMEAEHMVGSDGPEAEFAPELRLSQHEIAELLFTHTDYSAAYLATAKAYVDAFEHVVSEALDMPLGLAFESMTSPREYNFATDRLFAYVSRETIAALFARSAADEHKALADVVRERFTSRSGFASYYETDLDAWLSKPVDEWDHNELETLLLACMKLGGLDEDWDWAVYYSVVDCDGLYNEWSNAVDWAKFDAAREELRADKEAELRADDPDYVPPPQRCPYTLDLFTGR